VGTSNNQRRSVGYRHSASGADYNFVFPKSRKMPTAQCYCRVNLRVEQLNCDRKLLLVLMELDILDSQVIK